ncbi:MAG: MarR family transcriptional regulator [Acidobacteria bacterium]|nr:MarR family transcriptional regulator [Acidobacteriota bacterium]
MAKEPWDDPRITTFGMLLEAHDALLCQMAGLPGLDAQLPMTWFEVLLRLARSGGELRMAELAAQVRLSTSGLTRLIDRIEAAGLVERRHCTEDRRGSFAVLTPGGQDLLRQALPAHIDAIERLVVGPLGDDVPVLEDLLRRLRDNAHPASH